MYINTIGKRKDLKIGGSFFLWFFSVNLVILKDLSYNKANYLYRKGIRKDGRAENKKTSGSCI